MTVHFQIRKKPIESEEAAWILFNICEGLKFAHKQKIIHRDLKPQNILLKNGVPKISDWGSFADYLRVNNNHCHIIYTTLRSAGTDQQQKSKMNGLISGSSV